MVVKEGVETWLVTAAASTPMCSCPVENADERVLDSLFTACGYGSVLCAG